MEIVFILLVGVMALLFWHKERPMPIESELKSVLEAGFDVSAGHRHVHRCGKNRYVVLDLSGQEAPWLEEFFDEPQGAVRRFLEVSTPRKFDV